VDIGFIHSVDQPVDLAISDEFQATALTRE